MTHVGEKLRLQFVCSAKMIGLFVQHGAASDDRAERIATQLVERYPDSRYTAHVRKPLIHLLGRKVRMQKATPDQKELFERLGEDERALGNR